LTFAGARQMRAPFGAVEREFIAAPILAAKGS
jgi:hypothetical protein